jgi:hypothetical protein
MAHCLLRHFFGQFQGFLFAGVAHTYVEVNTALQYMQAVCTPGFLLLLTIPFKLVTPPHLILNTGYETDVKKT